MDEDQREQYRGYELSWRELETSDGWGNGGTIDHHHRGGVLVTKIEPTDYFLDSPKDALKSFLEKARARIDRAAS